MLDCSVLIEAERGRIELRTRTSLPDAEPVALSAITESEMMRAVHRTATQQRRRSREGFVPGILGEIPSTKIRTRIRLNLGGSNRMKEPLSPEPPP